MPMSGDLPIVPLSRWNRSVDVSVMTLEKFNSHVNGWMSSWMIELDYFQVASEERAASSGGPAPSADLKPLFPIVAVVTDELHIMGDRVRGYLLECTMIKLKGLRRRQLELGQLPLQVLALSATLPNLDQVGRWLDASVHKEASLTLSHPLDIHLVLDREVFCLNPYGSASGLSEFLASAAPKPLPPFPKSLCAQSPGQSQTYFFIYASIRRAFLDPISESPTEEAFCQAIRGFQVLVFCPTKLWCERMALGLTDALLQFAERDSPSIRAAVTSLIGARHPELWKSSRRMRASNIIRENAYLEGRSNLMSPSNESSSKLSACVERGTAWHHSSLTASEKHLVEKGYRGGDLFALFATSTLAVGVTLPARRVVIRSPVVGAEALDPASFRQMIGRAGRSGTLRNEQQMGEVFILGVDECAKQIGTSKEAQLEFLEVLLGPVPAIQSCLSDQRLVRLTLELLTIGLWRSSAHLYQALFRDSLWGVQQEDALISVKDRQRSIVERVDRCVKYLQAHSMIRGFNERWSVYQSAFRSPIVLIRFFLHLISPPGLNETANNSVDVSRDPSIIFFPKQYRIFNTCIAPHLKESAGSGPKGSTFDEIVQSLSDSSDSLRIPHNASRQEDAPSDPRSMPIRWTSIAYACVEASLHPAKALEITADLLKASLMGVHTTRDIHLLFIVMDCSYHFPVKWDKLDSFLKFLSNGSTASTDLYKKQTRQHLPPVAERLGDSAVGETEALLRRNIDMYLGGKSLDLSHGPLAPKDPEHHDRILPLMKALGISATWVAYIVRTPMLDKIKNWNLVQYHDRLLHGDVRLDVLLTLYLVSNHKRFYMAMVMSDFLAMDRTLPSLAAKYSVPVNAILALKTNTIHSCGSISTFAKRVGMSGLSAMLRDVGERLASTLDVTALPPHCLQLLEVDMVFGYRAVAFYSAGVDSVQKLAETSINDIFQITMSCARHSNNQENEALDSAETRRRLWEMAVGIQKSSRGIIMAELESEMLSILPPSLVEGDGLDEVQLNENDRQLMVEEWLMAEDDGEEQSRSDSSSSTLDLGSIEAFGEEFDFLRMKRIEKSEALVEARRMSLETLQLSETDGDFR
eukprot:GHVH01017249.1.p1 GENE.GHVH01017249.1~~GHVH01017249.1.p1  ORF type:complete len:1092 (+),score=217.08 GHVH01017249.1:936-4211(+)